MNPRILKALGALIFTIGLIYAAWFAAFLPKAIEATSESGEHIMIEPVGVGRITVWWDGAGSRFAGGILFMVIGGLMARAAKKKPASKEGEKTEEGDAAQTLDGIVAALADLPVDLPADAAKLADALDLILTERVPAFLDQRQAIIDSLGLERFAEMIGYFASMERATARAWSALTDEAYQEVEPSIARAKRSAKSAQDAYAGES